MSIWGRIALLIGFSMFAVGFGKWISRRGK